MLVGRENFSVTLQVPFLALAEIWNVLENTLSIVLCLTQEELIHKLKFIAFQLTLWSHPRPWKWGCAASPPHTGMRDTDSVAGTQLTSLHVIQYGHRTSYADYKCTSFLKNDLCHIFVYNMNSIYSGKNDFFCYLDMHVKNFVFYIIYPN